MSLSRRAVNGALIGVFSRMLFDRIHEKKILKKYEETKEIPNKKSYGLGLSAVFFFGSVGFFYTNRIMAIVLTFFLFLPDLSFAVFFIGLFNPFGFLVFFLIKPFQLYLMWASILSYNNMVLQLFGEYGGYD